jgi:hypothetical protein
VTSTSLVAAKRAYLRRRHDDDHLSWRQLRDLEFPGISHTVLRDLAVKGKVPRERRVLVVLKLLAERPEHSQEWHTIEAMANMTRHGVRWKKRKKQKVTGT